MVYQGNFMKNAYYFQRQNEKRHRKNFKQIYIVYLLRIHSCVNQMLDFQLISFQII